jgi:hypothetical protein
MPTLFRECASIPTSQVPGSYIYSILPLAGQKLAALTSADELVLIDKTSLDPLGRHDDDVVPRSVTCMTQHDNSEHSVVCAGGDGTVAVFDMRARGRVSYFKTGQAYLHQHDGSTAMGLTDLELDIKTGQ